MHAAPARMGCGERHHALRRTVALLLVTLVLLSAATVSHASFSRLLVPEDRSVSVAMTVRDSGKNASSNVTSVASSNENKWTWNEVESRGIIPNAREGHSMTAIEDFLLLFGGCYLDKQCFNDIHIYTPSTRRWTQPFVEGHAPSEREGHTATLVGAIVYIFGGSSQLGYLRDVAYLNLQPSGHKNDQQGDELSLQWGFPDIGGIAPAAREGHSASLYGTRIYYFGGYTDAGYSNELVVLDTDVMAWEHPSVGGLKPTAREGHVVIAQRGRMMVQGGFTNGGCLADAWVFDRVTNTWEKANAKGVGPTARENSAAVAVNGEMVLVGGCNFGKRRCHCDVHVLNMKTYDWREETVGKRGGKAPAPRESHTMTALRGDIFVFGGCYLGQKCFNDMYTLEHKDGPVVCGDTERSCSGNGECRSYWNMASNQTVYGCACRPGWSGDACDNKVSCPSKCSGHGICRSNNRCACRAGWAGRACARKVTCPGLTRNLENGAVVHGNCSGHGMCQQNGACFCDDGWGGDGCEFTRSCNSGCSGHGLCLYKTNATESLPPLTDPFAQEGIDQGMGLWFAAVKNGTKALRRNNTATHGNRTANATSKGLKGPLFPYQKFKGVGASITHSKSLRDDTEDEGTDEEMSGELTSDGEDMSSDMSGANVFLEEGDRNLRSGVQRQIRRRRRRRKMRRQDEMVPILPDTFCQCYKGYYGVDCAGNGIPPTPVVVSVARKNGSNATKDSGFFPGDQISGSNPPVHVPKANKKMQSLQNVKNDPPKEGDRKLAAASVASNVLRIIQSDAKTVKVHSAEASANEVLGSKCPAHCSHHGVCVSQRCYCHHGFTGNACNIKMTSDMSVNVRSVVVESGLFKFAGSFFLVGVLAAMFSGKMNTFGRRLIGRKKRLPAHAIPLQNHW